VRTTLGTRVTSVGPDGSDGRLRAAYHRDLRASARETTRPLGIVALVAFPAWSGFDYLLVPAQARDFLLVRVVFEVAIAAAWIALCSRRIGARWPQHIAVVLVALPEVAIAWMVPRSAPHLEAYLLGCTLAVYCTAFVIVWHWKLTVLLVAVTLTAVAGCVATAPAPVSAGELATIGFYLGTAGALAIVAQIYRYRVGWQHFLTQAALEAEHRHNGALLEELSRLSREDALTGVANRRAWEEHLSAEIARARRAGTPMSVIYGDFDHFKEVNDHYGHVIGDEVLSAGTALVAKRVRAGDYVARIGGDEFAIACPGATLADAIVLADTLIELSRCEPWPAGVHMTFSLGVAELHPGDAGSDLVHRADAALYRAKLTRDRVCTELDQLHEGRGARLHRVG
jgi:diguanylate cyclase (GGDEF)-like protein